MTRSILVLGATGFIGRRLVGSLVKSGRPVIVARRQGTQTDVPFDDGVTEILLRDPTYRHLESSIADHPISAIVNCAAYGVRPQDRDPTLMHMVNVDLPTALVDIAGRKGAVVVHLGSSAEYAACPTGGRIAETARPELGKLYGTTKYCGGVLANVSARALSVPSAVLRAFNVYGPGEAAHRLLPNLVAHLLRNERVPLSHGEQVRDFVHVDDVNNAIETAIHGLMEGTLQAWEAYNICTGSASSVRVFAETVASCLGVTQELLGFGDLPVRPDETSWLVGDNRRFSDATGWSPAFRLEHGIMASISEMQSREQRSSQ